MSRDPSSFEDWPKGERPRERLIKFGPAQLSDAQLLAILLGTGDRKSRKNAFDLSLDLLKTFGNLRKLENASVAEMCQVPGIGTTKAVQIKAALEVGKRLISQEVGEDPIMSHSQDFVDHFGPFMRNLKKEVVRVVCLNHKLRVINDFTISEGSLNASIVHPREVMIPAIKESAASIALLHNHPSGDPDPSQADIEITHRVTKSCEIIGITLIDHIIIGDRSYYSFADEGLI